MNRWRQVILLCVVLTVALRVVGSWGQVYVEDEIWLLGTDPYYHWRHVVHILEGGLERQDWLTHYPEGQRSQVVGLFQLLLAAVAWLCGGTERAALQIMAWFPVASAAMTLLLVAGVTSRVAGDRAAAVATGVLALLPGEWGVRTLLGYGDNHAVEPLFVLAALLGALAVQQRPTPLRVGLAALPLVLVQLIWVGGPLVLLVHLVVLLAFWCAGAAAGVRVAGLVPVLAITGVACLAVAPFDLLVLRPGVQPLVGSACLASSAFFWVADRWLWDRLRGRRWAPILVFSMALGAGLIGIGLLQPDWLARLVEPHVATVAEHQQVSVRSLWIRHGIWVPVALIGVFWLSGPEAVLLGAAGGCWFAMWVASWDFGYLAPVALAPVFGVLIDRLSGRVRAVTLLVCAWPLLLMGRPPSPPQSMAPGWSQAMAWMRSNTPPVHAPTDGVWPAGSYGVRSAWSYGHFVAALGRRPVVWSQGVDPDSARWLWSPPAVALRDLCVRCEGTEEVRYVVLDATTLGGAVFMSRIEAGLGVDHVVQYTSEGRPELGPTYTESIASRLYNDRAAGLGRFRLVFESPEPAWVGLVVFESGLGGPQALSSPPSESEGVVYSTVEPHGAVKIFEVVPGVVIEGTAPPGEVLLALRPEVAGRSEPLELIWRSPVRDGHWRLHVGQAGPAVVLHHHDGATTGLGGLQISEAQVRKGVKLQLRARP